MVLRLLNGVLMSGLRSVLNKGGTLSGFNRANHPKIVNN
jgi:hypothetical protein